MKLKKFNGINNVDAPERLPVTTEGAADLREAENVDIDKSFRVSRRKGSTKRYSGSGVHSFWTNKTKNLALFIEGNDLCQFNADYTKTVLRSGLSLNRRMSYAEVNGDVYYTDGVVTGMIRDGVSRSWGIDVPVSQPLLSVVGGALDAGVYQVTITYVRADGEESGAGVASVITLTSTGGVSVLGIPTSPDSTVTAVNVYCTSANGDILYYAGQVANGTSSYTITGGHFTLPLKTQFMTPPPPGSLIEYHYGRMYVVVGDAIFYSEAYGFGLFSLAYNYLHFPTDVTMIGSVTNGLFISADKTYFQHGSAVAETSVRVIEGSTAIKHSMTRTEGARIKDAPAGPALMWLSDDGVFVGGGDGFIRNLTSEKWSFAGASSGAGLIREYNGSTQFVGLLKNADEDANNAYVGDVATAEIIRQGV